jgi:hypothetical protein
MESAVRSGFMAAEAVLGTTGLSLETRPLEGFAGLVNRLGAKRRRGARDRAWRTPPTARPRSHP